MSTEAPAAPAKKFVMTDEHKRKLAEGRARKVAEKAAAKSVAPAPDSSALYAELERLKAELAVLKAAPSATPIAATAPTKLDAQVSVECVYRVKPRGGWKKVAEVGHIVVNSADDPRWDGEFLDPPFNGTPSGCLEVARVTRVGGQIVKTEDIMGGPSHMNVARAFMRQFQANAAAGAEKPWDTEHFHRDQIEQAEKAKREGRTEDLAVIIEALKLAMKGGPESMKVTA